MTHQEPTHALVALFIDYENIVRSVNEHLGSSINWRIIYDAAQTYGRIIVRRAYADWSNYTHAQQDLLALGFDLVHVASYHGKNAADIRLVIDAVDLAARGETPFTHAIIASGDSDFTDLAHYLRLRGKTVVGIGVRATSALLLISACDTFHYYDDLLEKKPATNGLSHRPEKKDGVEAYLNAIAHKVRMSAHPDRPKAILLFYKFACQHPNTSLIDLSQAFKTFAKEQQSPISPTIANEVIHQLFHTYCFEFAPPEDEDQPLWSRTVSFAAGIESASDLLRKCDRGLLELLTKSMPNTPIDPSIAAQMLYGTADNPRLVEYVSNLLAEIAPS
nr:NYN domain-containing protein [Ardenticatena sp.]